MDLCGHRARTRTCKPHSGAGVADDAGACRLDAALLLLHAVKQWTGQYGGEHQVCAAAASS